MKKIILLSIISILFSSCKKELPNNIETALYDYSIMKQTVKPFQDFIISLDSTQISKMPLDSLNSLLIKNKTDNEMVDERLTKLEELLKFNPEYSDNEKVKSEIAPIYLGDKYWNNLNYIIKRKTLILTKK